jgi:peptidyl-prolyl cis-trans isomerase A (cyclophilin A)
MVESLHRPIFTLKIASLAALGTLAALGCRSTPPEPSPARSKTAETATAASSANAAVAAAPGESAAVAGGEPMGSSTAAAKPSESTSTSAPLAAPAVKEVPISPDDPLKGRFTMADATKGLPGKGPLVATIVTELGTLTCDLFEDRAPITVANFVGLARGLRPFKDASGKWVKKPGYDGTTFHRVIKGFMIQGGDPKGNGSGEPGYVIPDEIWEGARHDRRGQLCMANRGHDTNGMQFFITDGAAPHLDGNYTIFGYCGPDAVIEKLASVATLGDRAEKPTKITKVTIKRKG